MDLSLKTDERPLSRRGYLVSWLVMTIVAAPLWIWMDGRYGLLKAAFYALFFAWAYGIKRSTLDVAVFTLIMTGLQVFSRQLVNYHQLVLVANSAELVPLMAHATLTLLATWLMSWLFDLRGTPGPTYTRLACLYMIFYLGAFIPHALGVMIWEGLPLSFYHPVQYVLLLAVPLVLWWLGARLVLVAQRFIPPLKAEAGWKHRFKDIENTRAVVFSCLALFVVSAVWFGFVHFTIGKLGLDMHYGISPGCAADPGLNGFILHSFRAALVIDDTCLSSASMLSRGVDYLEIVITLFLLLVLVQALALAFSAQKTDQPPKQDG